MDDKGAITSLGAVAAGDNRSGAGIVMQAGVGPNGPDYLRFVEAYLNPVNLVQPGESIQGGKVAKTFENELAGRALWFRRQHRPGPRLLRRPAGRATTGLCP